MKKEFNTFIYLLGALLLMPKPEVKASLSQDSMPSILAAGAAVGACAASIGTFYYYRYVRNVLVPGIVKDEARRLSDCLRVENNNYPTTYDELYGRAEALRNSLRPYSLNVETMNNIGWFNKMTLSMFYNPQNLQSQVNEVCADRMKHYIGGFFRKRVDKLQQLNSGIPYRNSYDTCGFANVMDVVQQALPAIDQTYLSNRYKRYLKEMAGNDIAKRGQSVREWIAQSRTKLYGRPGAKGDGYHDELRTKALSEFSGPDQDRIKILIHTKKRYTNNVLEINDISRYLTLTVPVYYGERGHFDRVYKNIGPGNYIVMSDVSKALEKINFDAYHEDRAIPDRRYGGVDWGEPFDMFPARIGVGTDALPVSHSVEFNPWTKVRVGIEMQRNGMHGITPSPFLFTGARIPVHFEPGAEHTYAIFPHYNLNGPLLGDVG